MYKKAWCTCRVVVLPIYTKPIAFLPFSLTSPSSLLKLPIDSLETLSFLAFTSICTTWPSFPYTCRLLFISSTHKLVVSRNFLSIRVVLNCFYLLIFYFIREYLTGIFCSWTSISLGCWKSGALRLQSVFIWSQGSHVGVPNKTIPVITAPSFLWKKVNTPPSLYPPPLPWLFFTNKW